MPVLLIVVLAVIAVGLVASLAVPAIVGDPKPPREVAPVEVRAPVEPGPAASSSERERVDAPGAAYVDPYEVDPQPSDGASGSYDPRDWNDDVAPADTGRTRGAVGRLGF